MPIGRKRSRKLLKKSQCRCLLSQGQSIALAVHLRVFQDLHQIRQGVATCLTKANLGMVLLNHFILALVDPKCCSLRGCLLDLSSLCVEVLKLEKQSLVAARCSLGLACLNHCSLGLSP